MPVPFVQTSFVLEDVSPRSSMSITPSASPVMATQQQQQHLRRRSSQIHLQSPFSPRMTYDEKTGEIRMASSEKPTSWSIPKSKPSSSKAGLLAWRKQSEGLASWIGPPRKTGAPLLPKPWKTVLSYSSLTFITLYALSRLLPSHYVGSTDILANLSFATIRHACDPYSAFGTLEVDDSDADLNRWVPFDPTCQPPALMANLRDEDSTADFSWLRAKTVLLVGDIVSREHVENFCSLLGEQSEIIRPSHKYSPESLKQRSKNRAGEPSGRQQPSRLSRRASERQQIKSGRDASSPRMCYIPKHDFLLISVMHYGLDQEDYWRDSDMPQYSAPGMFEHRLSDIVEPLMQNVRADGRASAPDLVEVTSGVWDLARWAEQDIDAQKATDMPLSDDRVTWWRFRAGQVLSKVHKTFPKASSLLWRTSYYPHDQVAEYEYFQDKISRRDDNATMTHDPAFFAHNRINQLDSAVRSLVLPKQTATGHVEAPHSEFRMNEWGQLLKGHNAHQRDRLHGDPLPGGYVWSDIMLYELQRAASASHK